MSKSACPICKLEITKIIGPYRTLSSELEGRDKVECQHCHLVYMSPLPSESKWQEYNKNYFEKAHGGLAVNKRARNYHMALAKIRGNFIKTVAEKNNIGIKSIFEVGPGNGNFAYNWFQFEPDTEYSANETDVSLHENLKELGVKIIRDEEVTQIENKSNDLVVISHVLEHTLEPVEFLRMMTMSLKSGGLLFIEVPCMDYKYKTSDEPHVLFFNQKAMLNLFAELDFSDVGISYYGETHQLLKRQIRQGKIFRIMSRIVSEINSIVSNKNQAEKNLTNDEWKAVSKFKANKKQTEPARWLRVTAIKK